jgi:hypothetical protein
MDDLKAFIAEEKNNLLRTTIEDEFKNFLDANEEPLEKMFNEQHNFQTNTRGVKVRGSFESQQEAEMRCKMLREIDPSHDIFVGPVGMWMPWEPEAYKTGKVEYLEEELNTLMAEKIKNEEKAKQQFDKRILETKKAAIANNVKLAKEHGNKLTQNIDDEGNLYGVNNTIEDNLKDKEDLTSADIRKELFQGENIVTKSRNNKFDPKKHMKK